MTDTPMTPGSWEWIVAHLDEASFSTGSPLTIEEIQHILDYEYPENLFRNFERAMNDFYCEQVLSGRLAVERVRETANVLAFRHTRPAYPVHIVVIPKQHIPSLVDFAPGDDALLLELLAVIREVAASVLAEHGACRVITNLGDYQESKHLHWHVVSGERL